MQDNHPRRESLIPKKRIAQIAAYSGKIGKN
jgi:hypothetical protein